MIALWFYYWFNLYELIILDYFVLVNKVGTTLFCLFVFCDMGDVKITYI